MTSYRSFLNKNRKTNFGKSRHVNLVDVSPKKYTGRQSATLHKQLSSTTRLVYLHLQESYPIFSCLYAAESETVICNQINGDNVLTVKVTTGSLVTNVTMTLYLVHAIYIYHSP